MKKKYFISFDYSGRGFNKFMFFIFEMDLENQSLVDVCRQRINKEDGEAMAIEAQIKVLAFNNVE